MTQTLPRSLSQGGSTILYRHLILCVMLLLSAVSASAAVPASSINLSVEASATDLSAIVNQSLPKELYKGQGGLGTAVTVQRTGPVTVTASDNFIYLTLPIQLTFSYGFYESYPLRAGLRFKARVNVTPGLASEDRAVLYRSVRQSGRHPQAGAAFPEAEKVWLRALPSRYSGCWHRSLTTK